MCSPVPELEFISLQVHNAVAVIKFARPKAGNALNRQTFKDLLAATHWAAENPNVRIIVQSGEGRYFTTGLDLLDGTYHDQNTVLPEETIQTLDAYHKLLIMTDKILIAAINGPGVGYGLSSIALFDLVYSVPEAYFFAPFVKWGLSAEACSSFTLPHILGRQKAAAVLLAQERLSAKELQKAGLVSRTVAASQLMPAVMRVAEKMADLPMDSLRLNKRLMIAPLRQALMQANEEEMKVLRQTARSREAKVAMRSFAQGRQQRNESKL